jgi:GTP cyclohydrolase I
MNSEKIKVLVRELLLEIGEDPNREGLVATPERFTEMLRFLFSGYRASLDNIVQDAVFSQHTNNMVVMKDIEIYSLCEHHMLPFFGRCHIGYIAHGRVLGISKLARIADMFARRLQLQERLTEQIALAIQDSIGADGVGVVVEAQHLCMMMRGVRKQSSVMTTSSVLGTFRSSATTRNEFLSLIAHKHV